MYVHMSISVPVLAYVRGCVNSIKSESDKLDHKSQKPKNTSKVEVLSTTSFRIEFWRRGESLVYIFDGGVIEIPKNLLFVQKIQAIDGIEWKVEYFNAISFTYLYNFWRWHQSCWNPVDFVPRFLFYPYKEPTELNTNT